MNRYFLTLAVCASTLVFTACGDRKKSDSTSVDSTATTLSSADATSTIAITGHLADLGLTPNSHWRGINLGDEFTKVKAAEKGEPFESDADHIGYTIELKSLESADVLYYQTNSNVSAIDVDLFLNSRQAVSDYQKELGAYFTARYGASKPAEGGTLWTGRQGEQIVLKDVSKGKDFGLKVKIGPANSATTASVK
ncbi:hypothetical protein [Spirosoma fluviale]|uniref:Lipoprotein n=1 Tax=Spirosoma fluviale TaxID=1597977 RepID=A0A286GP29_9BACT|nr:hypothetical protein [Spirosoma fluviale]SOD97262.1 hypothetical protein SAMN06269250_5698 [Spirosoma fluviale]